MRALAAAVAALLLASCYEPAGECAADADCLDDQVCGDAGLCVPGTRPPPADAPVAAADRYDFTGGGPFEVAAGAGVLLNDVDPGGGALTALIEPAGVTSTSARGTVYLAADGSFTYVPPALGWTGADAFTYRASNGAVTSPIATVTITVAP